MTTIYLDDTEPEFTVIRTDDEHGNVELTVVANRTRITLNVGHIHDDVMNLRELLSMIVDTLDEEILDGWIDTPEEEDAYLGDDRHGYFASFSGKQLGGRYGFPTLDIAAYELAKAMVEAGEFTNVWYQDERGGIEPWHEQHRKFFDQGGDGLAPLVGVQYEPGDRVHVQEGDWPMVVDQDYGEHGIVIYTDGDWTIRRHIPHEDRNQLTKIEEA